MTKRAAAEPAAAKSAAAKSAAATSAPDRPTAPLAQKTARRRTAAADPGAVARAPWSATTRQLGRIARRQLFFIGGAPRSGTTWLQQMLDAHPEVRCRGEGLFLHHLAVPLEKLMNERAAVIAGKNRDLFRHTGGFPQHERADTEHLVGTAILLALARCGIEPGCRAVGEKTPENVFFFPRLRALFPAGRFIAIARDPRDVLSSAWHLFGRPQQQSIEGFVAGALPPMVSGAKAMLSFSQACPDACLLVTYEALRTDPLPVLARLFALLGVATDQAVLDRIVTATEFSAATGGRPAGVAEHGAFLRRGVVGDWRETLPPACTGLILDQLGWSFPAFGWTV